MMKTVRTLAVLLALLLPALPAGATTAGDCVAVIESLKVDTDHEEMYLSMGPRGSTANRTRDRVGLLGKLTNAQIDIGKSESYALQGKLGEAAQKLAAALGKLTDYVNKVLSLMAEGKIGPSADLDGDGVADVTPQDLVDGGNAAILCAQRIGS